MCLPISEVNNVRILLLDFSLLYTSIIFICHFIAWYSATSVNTERDAHKHTFIMRAKDGCTFHYPRKNMSQDIQEVFEIRNPHTPRDAHIYPNL